MNRRIRGIVGVLFVAAFAVLLAFFLRGLNDAKSGQGDGFELIASDENPEIFKYVSSGDLEKVSKELEKGTDINVITYNGKTLLHYAVAYEQTEMAKYLIEKGIKTDEMDSYNNTPIMEAVYLGNEEIYNLLKETSDLKARDGQNNTLLHLAAWSGNIEMYNDILEQDIDINAVNLANKTSIYYSVNQEMLENIMEKMNVAKIDEQMAKELLFYTPSSEIVEYLIENNLVDINALDEEKNNAIYYAMQNLSADVINKLIQKGIDVNNQNEAGNTALHYCAYDGYDEMAQILLNANADKSIRNNDGLTPLDIAKEIGSPEVIEVLGGK